MELSIIIVNWNYERLLRNCLLSIKENPCDAPYEIIVVDNASDDGSRDMLRNEFPEVALIENPVNEGFARANNRGVAAARGRFLLFLNPDTLIRPGALTEPLEFAKRTPDAGGVGIKTLSHRNKIQSTAFNAPGIIRMAALLLGLNRYVSVSRFKNYSKIMTPYYVQGSFLLIRKDLFDDVGGFDERFFLYFEDADLCRRVGDAGYRIYHLPQPAIHHFGGSNLALEGKKLEEFVKSLLLFYRKHRSLKDRKRLGLALKWTFRLMWIATFDKNRKKLCRKLNRLLEIRLDRENVMRED